MEKLKKLEYELELTKRKLVQLQNEQKKINADKRSKNQKIHGKNNLTENDRRLKQIIIEKRRLLANQKNLSEKINHLINENPIIA